MTGILEGKEVEGKIGDVGSYSIDATKEGKVLIALSVEKDFGGALVKSVNSVEADLFSILEKVVAKTEAKWDDAVVAQLKAILGLVG